MNKADTLRALPEDAASIERSQTQPASQARLTWRRFRQHRLALAAAVVIIGFYSMVVLADFLAYSDPRESEAERGLLPPQRIHLIDNGSFRPYVHALEGHRDPQTFRRVYEPNPDQKLYLTLFARGYEYDFLGFIRSDLHLIGVEGARAEDSIFVLGTDLQGRDLWSRILSATRISMTIGLVAVVITLFLGIALGGVSGYYGGFIDTFIQRVIEVLHAIPTIPLWMGLAAALPRDWSVLRIYLAITIIISLVSWTHLARVVRGRFLSLRREEFVMAAKVVGCRESAIIFRHMLPSFLSHIIAVVTLAIPAMIISETSLSFLGLGIRPPAVSWGVLLQQAQNVQSIAVTPWLLVPAVPVIVAVLAFNFLGDGLRDAADPYSTIGR